MEKLVSPWPWGAPMIARDFACETPVYRCKGAAFSRERSYDRTVLRFASQGERALPEAAYELSYVHALLLDDRGQILNRRSHDSGRQTLLGPQTTWAHEFYDDHLARAASVVYEVEARIDTRRTLYTGKLGSIELDPETRLPWPLTPAPNSGGLVGDPLMQLSFSTWYNRGELEMFLMAASTCPNDGHRSELEVVLLDDAGAVVASRWMNFYINATGVGHNDFSLRLEKKLTRQLSKLELRGRTEVRSITRIGPILLEDGPSSN